MNAIKAKWMPLFAVLAACLAVLASLAVEASRPAPADVARPQTTGATVHEEQPLSNEIADFAQLD
jgi:hypothetical protein